MTTDTLELPPIDADMIGKTPAAIALATPQAAEPATLKQTALASFAPIESHMRTLAARYKDVAYDVTTTKGMADAKAARLVLREEGRYAVQRLQDRLKKEANDLKRTLDAKGDELIALVKPAEDAIHAQIEAEEQRKAAEREAKAAKERERIAGLDAKLSALSTWIDRCKEPGMTAERIEKGIALLEDAQIDPDEWQEYAARAEARKAEVLGVMNDLYGQAVVREAEAARLEAQRLENERIAAELAAQRAEIERQAAALRQQEQEIEAARQRAAAPVAAEAIADPQDAGAGKPENPGAVGPEAGQVEPRIRFKFDWFNERRAMRGAEAASLFVDDDADPDGPTLLWMSKSDIGRNMIAFGRQPALVQAWDAYTAYEARTITQDAQESGSSPADAPAPVDAPGMCASSTAESAEAVPSGDEGTAAHADESAAEPDYDALEAELVDGPASLETSDAVHIKAEDLPTLAPAPAEPQSTIRLCWDLLQVLKTPYGGRFPSHPKPGPEWWQEVRSRIEALEPRLAKMVGAN